MLSTEKLRTKYVKALEHERKTLTANLKSVEDQLAALNGQTKVVAFADTAKHRIDPRAGRKLSAKHKRAIRLGIKKSREAKKKAE